METKMSQTVQNEWHTKKNTAANKITISSLGRQEEECWTACAGAVYCERGGMDTWSEWVFFLNLSRWNSSRSHARLTLHHSNSQIYILIFNITVVKFCSKIEFLSVWVTNKVSSKKWILFLSSLTDVAPKSLADVCIPQPIL